LHSFLCGGKSSICSEAILPVNLDHPDIEDLPEQCVIMLSRVSIRPGRRRSGSEYAASLRSKHQEYGDTFSIDETIIFENGNQ